MWVDSLSVIRPRNRLYLHTFVLFLTMKSFTTIFAILPTVIFLAGSTLARPTCYDAGKDASTAFLRNAVDQACDDYLATGTWDAGESAPYCINYAFGKVDFRVRNNENRPRALSNDLCKSALKNICDGYCKFQGSDSLFFSRCGYDTLNSGWYFEHAITILSLCESRSS